MAAVDVDSRGVARGRCSSCACDGYSGGVEKKRCIGCGHPPGKHRAVNSSTSSSVSSSSGVSSISALSPPSSICDGGLGYSGDSAVFLSTGCQFPGCQRNSDFDLNTGIQKAYCQEHFLYTQIALQHAPAFTTPQWSLGNNDSSDIASSQSDSSDSDQDQISSSRIQSDGGIQSSAAAPSPSTNQGGGLANVLSSLFQFRSQQRAPNVKTNPQPSSSPRKRTQSGGPVPALARPMTAPIPSQRSIPAPAPQPPVQGPIPVPQTLPRQPVCKLPGCNRPRFVEPGGKMHDYCGRTHARQYEQLHAPQVPQHLQCATPGCKKQKYRNPNGGYFDYCSKYCHENGLISASTPNLQTAGCGTCSLPGCNRPKYQDPANGRIHDYCGRTHASQARAQGLQPSNPSMIRQANQQEFSQVSQQFTRDWDRRKGACPKVDFVYIVSNPALEARWSAYKQNLQNQTVEEYYHGTKLICNLSNMPCTNADCGVCGISNTGLDRRCIRKNINFQRFGHGFYLAPNSSKCHDYTQGANGYRAILLCAVCPGRKYILRTDHVNLKGPPAGYDCVYGQEGSSLNYAEIVVYNPDAVVPRYIIVYQKDGVHKIAK